MVKCVAMLVLLVMLVWAGPGMADNTVEADADTWIASNSPGSNYSGNVNPSAIVRNADSVTRVPIYSFTLPKVGAYETVTGASFRLISSENGTVYTADLAYTHNNPDLGSTTWNSAVSAGYISGLDGNYNPILGGNATSTGTSWSAAGNESDVLQYTDSDASDGLAKYIADTASPSLTPITLMMTSAGSAGADGGYFYGEGNGESLVFQPHARLSMQTELTNPTHTIEANRDTWIQSSAGGSNFETAVNPSTMLRNVPEVTRASLYSFTLPQLAAGEFVAGAQLDLEALGQDLADTPFTADFALVTSNPDLTTITWNSAVAGNIITGLDGNNNPVLGGNSIGAGENWHMLVDSGDHVRFTDGDASNGLAQLIAGAASTSAPTEITLMLMTTGSAESLAMFYGMENGEDPGVFEPHPRLSLTIVPEPMTMVLLAIGGLGVIRKRR